ncbi:hypothetical protein [Lentilactobacillus sp. Marseille-Q4993]|uniref:hypothetical protein n=1 Tax=Lentilactobacillus sp. Marseille-Q4993 TaxID=3039492 RepID=UPI0024BCE677|nr:hypothetical protein [Lentilactobacillus sp. Marseille-Q4993]
MQFNKKTLINLILFAIACVFTFSVGTSGQYKIAYAKHYKDVKIWSQKRMHMKSITLTHGKIYTYPDLTDKHPIKISKAKTGESFWWIYEIKYRLRNGRWALYRCVKTTPGKHKFYVGYVFHKYTTHPKWVSKIAIPKVGKHLANSQKDVMLLSKPKKSGGLINSYSRVPGMRTAKLYDGNYIYWLTNHPKFAVESVPGIHSLSEKFVNHTRHWQMYWTNDAPIDYGTTPGKKGFRLFSHMYDPLQSYFPLILGGKYGNQGFSTLYNWHQKILLVNRQTYNYKAN